MMNSSADEFGDNPFRSGGGNEDIFFDSKPQASPMNPGTDSQFQQQQQPMVGLQQPPQQAQPDMFAPQPDGAAPMMSSFPPPSGPMDNMAPTQPAPQPTQPTGQMAPPVATSWWGNLMLCMSLDTYRAYFDIDADDIVTRVRGVFLHFYKPEYFRNNILGVEKTDSLKGPDLYGPFWITMSLIFFIGVTSNMHDYLHRDEIDEFDYDINHLLHAATVLSSYAFLLPSIIWVTTRCMNMPSLMLVEWVCLYGYSLVPYAPAVVLSIIPFGLVSWILLMLATLVSGCFIIRNVAAPLLSTDVGQAKASPIIIFILACHFIFFLVLKLRFFHVSSSKPASGGE